MFDGLIFYMWFDVVVCFGFLVVLLLVRCMNW